MTELTGSWQFWAILSAIFAALTAIFAKIGVADINSDLATLIRTVVVLAALALLVWGTDKMQDLTAISARTWLFLVLSGLTTGASWLCYFRAMQLGDASRVAPVDKLSVAFVAVIAVTVLGRASVRSRVGRRWAGRIRGRPAGYHPLTGTPQLQADRSDLVLRLFTISISTVSHPSPNRWPYITP